MDRHYDTETLIDYLHGALDAGADAAIFTHLAACDECRAEYAAEVELGELLRASARRDERTMPTDLIALIRMSAARGSERKTMRAWLSGWRALVAAPAAVVVALALWYGGSDLRSAVRTPAAAIDARYYFEAHAAQTVTIPGGAPTTDTVAFEAASSPRPHLDAALVSADDPVIGVFAPGVGAGTSSR